MMQGLLVEALKDMTRAQVLAAKKEHRAVLREDTRWKTN